MFFHMGVYKDEIAERSFIHKSHIISLLNKTLLS